MCHLAHELRIANSNLLGIMTANQFTKQLLQRMRLRNHFHGPHFPPKPWPSCSHRNKNSCGIDTVNPDPTQVTIEPLLWLEARAGRGVAGRLLAAEGGGC